MRRTLVRRKLRKRENAIKAHRAKTGIAQAVIA
jgi:hypothetical protein